MKKILLFAIAISLGSIAFAINDVDCSVEENCHCNYFSQPRYYGIKGCRSCPVRENGHYVKCENVANKDGVIDRDCCWLNTPPHREPWENCYTNAYVILDPLYGPPWARQCVKLLNNLVRNTTGETTGNTGNGGNRSNGGNGGNGHNKIKINKNVVKKPITSAVTTAKSAPVGSVSVKQTSIQPNSEKTAK